jgi:hypothetical protein
LCGPPSLRSLLLRNVMPRSHKPAAAAIERQAGSRPRADRADPPALARFGCLVAFRIPDAERVGDKAKTSFGRKAELGAFLGWARDATYGSARVLSLSTGRVRVVRSMSIWYNITPEARFTPSYMKELENQIRRLGEASVEYAAVEHVAVEPERPCGEVGWGARQHHKPTACGRAGCTSCTSPSSVSCTNGLWVRRHTRRTTSWSGLA